MAFNRKEQLKTVFEDTMDQIRNNSDLRNATQLSVERTRFYAPDNYPMFEKSKPAMGGIKVTRNTTFSAARDLHKTYPYKKIAVLNFASATNPGGGVTRGSSAQEESLCRCSTLYPTLTQSAMWNQFYFVNRADKNVLHIMAFGGQFDAPPKEKKPNRNNESSPSKKKSTSKKNKSNGITYVLKRTDKDVQIIRQGSHARPEGTFSVRGHFRHYKNGRVIWIAEYVKGSGKNKDKKYRL